MMTNTPITLPDYQIAELIYEGSRTLVYQAIRISDEQAVIIKIFRNPHPNFNELVGFRNQYVITSNLEHPHIVKPLALERYHNGYALVMPDEGAIALTKYWQPVKSNLTEFFTIAIQLADALHYLAQQRIIHKDIKPANILIHPETGQVQLIDFSIASLLPKEQQQLVNPNVLEGTLAYISPEQTGRMNRGIDYRTDFYSLGIALYELLTGLLPFSSDDPMELIHSHIAQKCIPPHSFSDAQGIPYAQSLSKIILKLMAKNAEERYQSALGLKHDLERCLQSLEIAGTIADFELGERDICDRFIIPEKLYGRESEVSQLLEAFERVSQRDTEKMSQSELLLVSGFSGIGKTAVVNEIHKPIVRQRGYFIKGKFDQFNRNIPFSAFVGAFRDLLKQLLGESDAELGAWKIKILEAVGENGQVLIDVIPELEQIIGKQPPVPELSGSAAQNRFNLLFGKFVRVFSTLEHPLVIFLDDLQWADLASLNLMKVLMNDNDTGYLLLLGAYRDNEVFPAHPLMLTLAELEQNRREALVTLTLEPLAEHYIDQLVAQTLNCGEKLAQPLSELVYQKTQGNPFFTTQFLKGLQIDGFIKFNSSLGFWECDLVEVRDAALTDDVVKFVAGRLEKLPDTTQNVLKLAACIGNQFDLETLTVICEESSEEIATNLWEALQERLILPISEAYKFFHGSVEETKNSTLTVSYRFLHDRIQQAAYSLIREDQKQVTHLKIGQLLLNNTPEKELENRIFDVVNQLNIGIELIVEPAQREQLAQLNAMAGSKARVATAYDAAVTYLTTGLNLLTSQSWRNQYDLTLKLHELAADSEYLNTNFKTSKALVEKILNQAQDPLEKIKAYEIQIQSYTSQNKLLEAIKIGREALCLLDVFLPEDCDFETTILEHERLKKRLGDRPIKDLANLPKLSDPYQSAALRILASLFAAIYLAKPNLLPLKIFRMVEICIQYGNSPQSTIAYSLYGLFLCATGDIEPGYQFGTLATVVLEQFQAKELKSKVYLIFGLFVKHWNDLIQSVLPIFLEGLASGLENGDLEYVGYCANCYCQFFFWTGNNLENCESEADKYCNLMQDIKQEISLIWGNTWRQTVMNLRGKVDNPKILIGDCFNEEETLPYLIENNNINGICYIYLAKLILSYLFEDFANARESANQFEQYEQGAAGLLIIPLKNFYQSLSLLALDSPEQTHILEKITENQKTLQKWADFAPMNYSHKFELVEAERHHVLGNRIDAIEFYDRAIAGAKENGYTQDEALANELAAKFYLHWGKEKVASGYMQEAYYSYSRWGAKAKTDYLEKKYPQLLIPILQQSPSSLSLEATQSLGTIISSSSSSSLDLTSAIKASQTISEEIELNSLLAKLMNIVLENAGADKGILLLNPSGSWQIFAQCNPEDCSLSQTFLEDTDAVPKSIINTVKRTQETLLINNLKQDQTFAGDSYWRQQQPQSICCTPILHQGKLIGLLYLENQLATDTFTPDRIKILNLLTSQAAISLENAHLYNTLEQKVQQRTAELSDALDDLKATQKQLVESEKMAALGGLVAGVAHEINTPIGTSITIASTLADETQSFLDKVTQGQLKRSVLNNYLDLAKESTQLMLNNLRRAGDLVQSFKQISADQSYLEQRCFHLKEYLNEIALSVAPQLKSKHHALTVEGDETLMIESYPGLLAQIITNLVTNSIIHGYSSQERGKLNLKIYQEEDRVKIIYRDNGCGIAPENLSKIFEPFFTTARQKGGTGLGLHIVYNLVTQKLQGTIVVSSEVRQGVQFIITLPQCVDQ